MVPVLRGMGGDAQRVAQMSAHCSGMRFRHLSLPVWLLHDRWQGELCLVVIQGQSSTAVDDRTWSA